MFFSASLPSMPSKNQWEIPSGEDSQADKTTGPFAETQEQESGVPAEGDLSNRREGGPAERSPGGRARADWACFRGGLRDQAGALGKQKPPRMPRGRALPPGHTPPTGLTSSRAVLGLEFTRASNSNVGPKFVPKIAKVNTYNKIIIAGSLEREEGYSDN